MRVLTGSIPLIAAVSAAFADGDDLMCQFETECFEAEACDETAFELNVSKSDDGVVLGSIADEVQGQSSMNDRGTELIVAQGLSTLQILTVGTDGTARYTLHLTDGPAVLSYLGSCETP